MVNGVLTINKMKANDKLLFGVITIFTVLGILSYTKPSDVKMRTEFKVNWDKKELNYFDKKNAEIENILMDSIQERLNNKIPRSIWNDLPRSVQIKFIMKMDSITRNSFMKNAKIKNYLLWKTINCHDFSIGIGVLGQYIQIK
jgi:hypothetical protein